MARSKVNVSNLATIVHSARAVADASSDRSTPFQWTPEERSTLQAFGRAKGYSEDDIAEVLSRSESDEKFHQAMIDDLDLEDMLTAFGGEQFGRAEAEEDETEGAS